MSAVTAATWSEADHPRHEAGSPEGGQFRTLYHVTPVQNRGSIRQGGLSVDAQKRYKDFKDKGVFVWDNFEDAWMYATTGERMYGDFDIWETTDEGLTLEPDPFFQAREDAKAKAGRQLFGEAGAWLTRESIPADRLKLRFGSPWFPDDRFKDLDEVRISNPDAGLEVHMSDGGITLDQIRVLPEKRGKGVASAALDDVLAFADSRGLAVALDIGHDELDQKMFGGLSQTAKEKWYRSRGFVPNRGRKKDFAFRQAWIRPAKLAVAASAWSEVAAGWDPAEHPRHPKGEPTGGRFAAKIETEVFSPTTETLAEIQGQLRQGVELGVWGPSRGEETVAPHGSAFSHAMAALEGGSADELFIQSDMNEDEYEDALGGGDNPISTFVIVARNEDGVPVGVGDFSEFNTQVGAGVLYGGAFGAVKGGGLPLFARFLDEAVTRGKGASWSAGNKRAGDLYMRLGIPNRGGPGAFSLTADEARTLADDMFAFARKGGGLTSSGWPALFASGWDESEHPRWPPGDERGGEFRPKGGVAGDAIDDMYGKELGQQIRDTLPRVKMKVGQAKNLREELGQWYYGQTGNPPEVQTVLDNWGNWTYTEMRWLQNELITQLKEPPNSGLLSVQYAKEIGRPLSQARNEGKRILDALDKQLTIEDFGLEYAKEHYPEFFEAKVPKIKQPNPRDQGIPEVYLSEKGTFKPGYDAKLKSDLVNSYFDLNPQKSTIHRVERQVSIETQAKVAEWWKGRNVDEQARQGWSDAEIFKVARADPQMPWELSAQVTRESGVRTRQVVESTLLHRFSPEDAARILEERGWMSQVEKARHTRAGGALWREPDLDDVRSKEILESISPAARYADIRGFHLGPVQTLVGEAAEISDKIHKQLAARDVRLYFGPPESTDLDEMWGIRDEKGRNGDRRTMKQVAGFYSPSERRVIISSDPRSGSASLATHEIGHAIGHVLKVDDDPALRGWHEGFKKTGKLGRYYLQNGNDYAGAQELWAEGVALHYHRQRIKRLGRDTVYPRSGPFKTADVAQTPEAQAYMDWVADTLALIERGGYR